MKLLSEKLLLLNQTVVDCLSEFEEKTIVKKFTEASIRVMQADFGFVWFGGAHARSFELIYKSPSIPYEPLPPREHGNSRRVLLDAKPIFIEDVKESNFVRDDAKPHMKSLVVIPMLYKEKTHGSIFLCFKEQQHFTDEDYELGHFIGNSAAQAITISNLYAELQDADKKKDTFIAVLAHELRNPLAPLLSAVQTLQLEAEAKDSNVESVVPGAVVREFGEIAERQVRNMTRILDDLLDVSRITHGKFQLEERSLNLVALVQETAKAVQPSIEDKQHTLRVAVPAEPIMVLGDAVRLEQVLMNLLKNAAGYMSSGGTIDVIVNKKGDQASVSVRDRGIGMSRETLSKIFDPFFRADASRERSRDGLGLGLMLSKTIMEMHGGSIVAESEGLNDGSAFTIYIPLQTETETEDEKKEDKFVVSDKKRILIVDDNRPAADTLAQLLKHYGHDAQAVYSPEEVLEQIAQHKPHTALLDIGLPNMGGHELGQMIKKYDPSIKLIAVSGYGQEEDRKKSEAAGFEHHLIKPADIQTLLKII